MNYGIISQEQLERIDDVLDNSLVKIGVGCVVVIDMAGNIITSREGSSQGVDTYSLAALAAGNFATVDAMAKLVGEDEFSLLFHKGTNANIHFAKINDDFLLISMFSSDLSLGHLRLNVSDAVDAILAICGG